ncbi:MAG: HAD-IA family hydrolase, partial [Chloroflexi bacterium]|nr:HAD-IA family hydrolase [Chloroflexota bacterium]
DGPLKLGQDNLDGIIFDWDGTIVDSAQAMRLSYRYAYQKHIGILFPKDEPEFRMLVQMRLAEGSAKFGGVHAEEITASYNWYYEHEAFNTSRVFPGMAETLIELRRRGHRLGVATNKAWNRVKADMNFLGLDGFVDAFTTSDDTRERKPDPAPLLKAADKLGVSSQSCAYVGDFGGDVIAAKAAGMVSVAVLWGGIFTSETLLAEKPDYVIERPAELLTLFPASKSGSSSSASRNATD